MKAVLEETVSSASEAEEVTVAEGNGWQEWRRHVLDRIRAHERKIDWISRKLQNIEIRMALILSGLMGLLEFLRHYVFDKLGP